MGVEWLTGFLPSWDWLERRLNRFRHPARVDLDLGWETTPLTFTDQTRKTYWRTISLEIVAGKAEEFVPAEGTVEVRSAGTDDWMMLRPLYCWVSLPEEIGAARAWEDHFSGPSVADALEGVPDSPESLELRVRIEDHHGTAIESDPLEVTVEELRREKTKRV